MAVRDIKGMPTRLVDDKEALDWVGPHVGAALTAPPPFDGDAAARRLTQAVQLGVRPRFDPWSLASRIAASKVGLTLLMATCLATGAGLNALLASPVVSERVVYVDRIVKEQVPPAAVPQLSNPAPASPAPTPAVARPSPKAPEAPLLSLPPAPIERPRPTLAIELGYIERAESALNNGRPQTALQELDAYQSSYPMGRFAVESGELRRRAQAAQADLAGAKE